MTPAEFHKRYMNWGKDVDGVAGIQCVDFAKEMFRLAKVPNYTAPIGGDGYADNIWYNRERWSKWFDFIPAGQFQDGDMVIFPHKSRGGWTHPSSHVCFYYSPNIEFGTNQGGNRKACDKVTNYSDALGALRWKGWAKETLNPKYGNNYIFHNGIVFRLCRGDAKRGYGLHLISTGDDGVKPIKQIDSDALIVAGKVNANYFVLKTGSHLGVEQGETKTGFVDKAPKQKEYLVYYQLKNGTCEYTTSDNYWCYRDEVIFACQPYSVRLHNGKKVFARSTGCGDKDDIKNYQTFAMKIGSDWCVGVTTTKCCPRDVCEFAEECDASECIIMDSGGSSQYIYSGKVQFQATRRKLPNVLAVAREV